jgi:sugar phosphate isomerase/epimerase
MLLSLAVSGELRASLPRVAKLGVHGVTLVSTSPRLDLPSLSASGRRELRHLIARQGLRLAAARHALPKRGLRPGVDLDAVLSGFRDALAAARDVGAERLLMDLGPLPPVARAAVKTPIGPVAGGLLVMPTAADIAQFTTAPAEAVAREPDFEASVDEALRVLGEAADLVQLPVALGSSLADAAALGRALDAADCQWFGADLDPSADDAAAFLSVHANRLLHVRGRDARRSGSRHEFVPLGEGDVDWSELHALLTDANFNGPLTINTAAALTTLRAAGFGL